mmetsp:Transcript_13745/g.29554  ORF Transcript_13745/g.29554 Transcript_13745/m.29554 type:complete len:373 (+) Transcript_13745:167-1285(+)|eukprot:CAMPEP_0202903200 /NCGR_PEP_ID=MMETSP1392-20130828/22588_1 /ASSEMBLY_ACC=CAM_ASM_000868 /TAXON_ID=225041 /ORGANISM="Chlamydomonas chlamydogama, Strain SAG 11-48b" /LENGTH=372 /DNA_ID=CAMNT_0049590249 /DNA_START=140 /DNA_END=1258 /DNA_ORIENTATION=-
MGRLNTPLVASLLLVFIFSVHGAAARRMLDGGPHRDYSSVWDLLQDQPSKFSTFSKFVQVAGLVNVYNSTMTQNTFLLATNDAFKAFYAEMGTNETAVLNQTATVRNLLLYHVHAGDAFNLYDGMVMHMAMGGDISIVTHWTGALAARDLMGRSAVMDNMGMPAGYSLAHITNRVLVPMTPTTLNEAFEWDADISITHLALTAANYTHLLTSNTTHTTVFAPSNKAWSTALTKLNMSLGQLLNDTETIHYIISTHIVPQTLTWSEFLSTSDSYTQPLNQDAIMYADQDPNTGAIIVRGMAAISNQRAYIVDGDRLGGQNAYVQVIDSVFLPVRRIPSPAKRLGPNPKLQLKRRLSRRLQSAQQAAHHRRSSR